MRSADGGAAQRSRSSPSPHLALVGVIAVAAVLGLGQRVEAQNRVKVAVLKVDLQEREAHRGDRYTAIIEAELESIGLFELLTSQQRAISSPARPEASPATLSACLEKRSCVQRLGRSWRAAVLIHLRAAKSLGGTRFTMRSFDAATGNLVRKQDEFANDSDTDVERAVRWMTRSVTSPVITTLAKGKATLQISCQVEDAKLFINDRPYGTVAKKRFKVSSGVFDLVVSREGYLPFHDRVVLLAGQTREFTVDLRRDPEKVAAEEPIALAPAAQPEEKGKPGLGRPGYVPGEPPGAPPPGGDRDEASPVWKTWWFWTIIGVAVAGAAGTTATFLLSDGGPSGQGGFEVTWQ